MSYDPSQNLDDFLKQNPTNNEADFNYFKQRDVIDAKRAASTGVTNETGNTGALETASYAERNALDKTGDFNTGASYFDKSRGVQVYAPGKSYFKLYNGGGVDTVAGALPTAGVTPNSPGGDNAPNNSNFTQQQNANPGFQQANLGYTPANGKTIQTTGQTIFNPKTGVDVQANPGNVWITYTDGTVEQRPAGAQPGTAVDAGTTGKSAQELGITKNTGIKDQAGNQLPINNQSDATSLAASGAPPQQIEQAITDQGLAPTNSLEFVGTTYNSPGGQLRTAAPGNAFYQDPVSKQVVERPAALQPLAKASTSKTIMTAQQQAQTGPGNTSVADKALAGHGFAANPQAWQQNPLESFSTTYSELLKSMGVPAVQTQIADIMKQQTDLGNSFAADVAKINANPYLSEADRSKTVALAQSKYDQQKSILTAQETLYQNVYDKSVDQAKYVATTTLAQYNADRKFTADELNAEADRALKQTNAESTLLNAGYKSIQGGLYDTRNNKWIVQPNATDLITLRAELQSQLSAQQAAQALSNALTVKATPGAASAGSFTFDEYAAQPENQGKSQSELFQTYNQAKSTTQSLADQIAALANQ